MLSKVMVIGVWVALAGVGGALAQTLSGIDGPAELPPPDYKGQSYVDSRGCVFLRAGYGGETTWVARVAQDRTAICGQTPSVVVPVEAAAAVVPEQDSAPTRPSRGAKRAVSTVAARAPVKIGCPSSVPVARRYATTDGGSVVICTAANGSLTGARSPIYPPGSGVGAALSPKRYPGVDIPLAQSRSTAATVADDGVNPPKGYEKAWKDGRLNPARGKGADPAVVVAKADAAMVAKPAPVAQAAGGSLFVQVGAFGEPANAAAASARLVALALPVAKGKFSKNGKTLQVIYAGPFASVGDAQTALAAARNSGFSDAFIR